jgi:NTP pyrophosphatase (non-canonical NTP hydrolase)
MTKDPIQNKIIDRIHQRAEYGDGKYGGQTMLTNTEYSTAKWLQEAQDEMLDGAAYIERLKELNFKSVEDQVKEFDTKFNIQKGSFDNPEVVERRINLIAEEYKEVLEAVMKKDKENLLKELCDLVYVCVGTATCLGMPFDLAFKRVHESNMTKEVPINNTGKKIIKGANYKPADLKDLV